MTKHAFKYGFIQGKGWVGVIFEDTPPPGPKNVVTVGLENSEADIERWCRGSTERMDRGEEELPCRVERERN
jgi:hypothetical protein